MGMGERILVLSVTRVDGVAWLVKLALDQYEVGFERRNGKLKLCYKIIHSRNSGGIPDSYMDCLRKRAYAILRG